MTLHVRDLIAIVLLASIVTPAVVGIGRAAVRAATRPSPRPAHFGIAPSTRRRSTDVSGRASARLGVLGWISAWAGAQVVVAIVIAVSGRSDPLPIPILAVAMVGSWSIYGAAVWAVSRQAGTGDVCIDYGIELRRDDAVGLLLGAAIQLAVVPAVYFPLRAVWPSTFTGDRLDQNATDLVARAGGASIVVLAVLVVIGAPLVEEIVYRGLLQRSVTAGTNVVVGWLVTSAIFTLVHFRPVEYPGLAAFALIVGAAAAITGRLGLPVMIHVGFNTAGLALAIW